MRAGVARSIALEGNAADVLPELVRRGIVPDVVTDQTSAHDALNGYVPNGLTLAEADVAAADGSRPSTSRDRWRRWRAHVRAMLALKRARRRDLRLRQQHPGAGGEGRRRRRVRDSRLRAGVHPAAVLRGQGTVPLGGAVGRSGRHRGDRRARARDVRRQRRALPLDSPGRRARRVPGTARAHLLARLRRARAVRAGDQRSRAPRRRHGADRHRPRSSRRRIGGLAQPRDREHAATAATRSRTGPSSTRC